MRHTLCPLAVEIEQYIQQYKGISQQAVNFSAIKALPILLPSKTHTEIELLTKKLRRSMCIYVEHCKNVRDMCAPLWRLEAALGLTIVDKR